MQAKRTNKRHQLLSAPFFWVEEPQEKGRYCRTDGGLHLTAEEHWTRGFCLFMDPWAEGRRRIRDRSWKVQTPRGEKNLGQPLGKEVSAEVPRKCLRWGQQSGGLQKSNQARNADIHRIMAGPEGLRLWLQLPPDTAVHWLYTKSGVGRAASLSRPARQNLVIAYGQAWKITHRILVHRQGLVISAGLL